MQENFLKKSLKSIFDSKDGVHLSAYIPKPKNVAEARKFALEISLLAHRYLEPVFSKEQFDEFFASIDQLLRDPKFVERINGNIGIFKNRDFLRVITVPIEVELNCFVASTFHVKPLLKWIQMDQQFQLIGFGKDSAYLYSGSQQALRLLKVAPYEEKFKNLLDQKSVKKGKSKNIFINQIHSLKNSFSEFTDGRDVTVFLAGHFEISKQFRESSKNLRFYPENVRIEFTDKIVGKTVDQIRAIQRLQCKLNIDRNLTEFEYALTLNRTKHNLFSIAKAAVQGQVEKLLISEEVEIFGKLDRKNGDLKLHAADLDHEDDDVLDDIAQTVMSFGGEVIIAKKSEIPKNKPILAILNNSEPHPIEVLHPSQQNNESRSPL